MEYSCTYDELGFLNNYLIHDIQIGERIGRGAYGRIMEAKWEGTVVAIKEIHSVFNDVGEEQFQALKIKFLNECKQSSRLHHPNIVRFLGIYYPAGARVPSLVMERLHCNLTNLLIQNPVVSLEVKLSILHQISLGLRYLHTRAKPIIHRDLSSNNILISRSMEAKITDFGTYRILETNKETPMSSVPGTPDFMPPEALIFSVEYKEEIDIFSFGCIMLHIFSHTWPSPLLTSNIVDPINHRLIPCSEFQRRHKYLKEVPKEIEEIIVPIIKKCLENHPGSRPRAEEISKQLEPLVCNMKQQLAENKEMPSAKISDLQMQLDDLQTDLAQCQAQLMQSEIKVDKKSAEINSLRTQLALLDDASSCVQISMKSIDFWKRLNLVWTKCADLPGPYWITSVAELDGNVYVTPFLSEGGLPYPLKYDSSKNQWSTLPDLPCIQFTLVAIPDLKQLLAIGGLSHDSLYPQLTPSDKVFAWDSNHGTRWITPYSNMLTARYHSSAVCYQSKVIVAGGVIKNGPPRVMTRAVEVLNIGANFSYWSKVEQLPYISNQPSSLLIDDMLYITAGFNKLYEIQTSIVAASLPALLHNHPYASGGQIWEKYPDLPYPSPSFNVYSKRLITFGGIHLVEQPNKKPAKWQLVPLVHIYNPDTNSWECVGKTDHKYYLGRSVHIGEDKILFIGGTTGKYITDNNDDLVTKCSLLTITHQC